MQALYACGNDARIGDTVEVVRGDDSGNPPKLVNGRQHQVKGIIPDFDGAPHPFLVVLDGRPSYESNFWTTRFRLVRRFSPSGFDPVAMGC